MAKELRWFKSSRSTMGEQNCVEVAVLGDGMAVCDSKVPDGARLAFSEQAWSAFTTTVKRDNSRHMAVGG